MASSSLDGELAEWREEMERAFMLPFRLLNSFYDPLTDLSVSNEAYELSTELPGWNTQDIDVRVDEDRVEVQCLNESKGRRAVAYRVYYLPGRADGSRAKATYRRGILSVTVPKLKEQWPRGVQVKVENQD